MEHKTKITITTSIAIILFGAAGFLLYLDTFPANSPYYFGEDTEGLFVVLAYFLCLPSGVSLAMIDIVVVIRYFQKKS